jgi:site-specific DNA-cytosine methylase
MNVLSLFDGMSCGQIALDRIGVKVDNYFASEIDEYAIKVAKHNYPNTQHIGDVTKVKADDLPKIDLLIGGSPCQGFSFSGKQLNFKDPRSRLFFEFVRLLKECRPKYFLLENVKMKKEYQDIISSYLGVEPVLINSSLVSAHNRPRQYWHNIPNFEMPEDKNITLEDILIKQPKQKREIIDSTVKPSVSVNVLRDYGYICTSEKDFYTMKVASGFSDNKVGLKKTPCLRAGNTSTYVKDGSCVRRMTPVEWERCQTVPDNYTAIVSDSQRYKMLGNGWTVDVVAHIFKGIDFA